VSAAIGNEQAWAAAAAWGQVPRMNEIETLMWRTERHPRLSSTICTLMLLDRAPKWERLVAAHEWATELIPRCRDRVLEPVVPVGPPAWVPDESFALEHHLRRVQLPAPGTMAQLLEHAQGVAMEPFDRARPLWSGHLIEGLPDGQAAYLLKLHHSLTDGLGGIQLMSLVQSRTRRHTPNKPGPTPPSAAAPADATDLALAELGEQARRVPDRLRGALLAAAGALTQPGDALAEALRFGASLRRTLTPPPAAPSPLLRGRTGTSWHFETME
jgi:diacylglycerol O-acyltransferase